MNNVYLAMYKAKGNWVDSLIRFFTGKPYSHCEVAIFNGKKYHCYSSSPRDKGVRMKVMHLPADKWDLIPVATNGGKIVAFYHRTKGKKYDFLGAIGCVLPLREKPSRYYCSEWCYEAIFGKKPEKELSPNELARILKNGTQ